MPTIYNLKTSKFIHLVNKLVFRTKIFAEQYVGKYRMAVLRYLWYFGTMVVQGPRRYWHCEREVLQYHNTAQN